MSTDRIIKGLEIGAQSNAYKLQVYRRLVHAQESLRWARARATLNWCAEKQFKRIDAASEIVAELIQELDDELFESGDS